MKYGAAHEAFQLLSRKYDGTAYVVLPQVANGTGFAANRWLDVVVASLWPSRGLWLHGYEIKISRHDWLRELKQAEKAEALYKHLDFFSILTVGDVIEPGELPETWGHVSADLVKKRLTVEKEAPRIHREESIDRTFVMSIFRSFDKTCVTGDLAAKLKAEFERGQEAGKRDAEYAAERSRDAATTNAAFLQAFQNAHGLDNWSLTAELGEKVGHFVRDFHRLHGWPAIVDMRKNLRMAIAVLEQLEGLPHV